MEESANRLTAVVLTVADLDRAVRLYEDGFGLALRIDDHQGDDRWISGRHAATSWTDGGFMLALERWGYDIRDQLAAVVAFQRRFRPELLDGTIDGECRAILLQLLLDRESGRTI